MSTRLKPVSDVNHHWILESPLAPGPRLMRTGSGPIADPDQREGEDGEADEEDDDDYEAPDVVGFLESGFASR